MEQGVQTDTTCNVGQFWELLARKLARESRYGVFLLFVSLFFLFCFFQIIHGLVSVDPSIVPKARITRPLSSGVIKFVEPWCQTATYQNPYIVRCEYVSGTLRCCWWTEPAYERLNDFKQATVEYYKTALSNYHCENPCTFKFVCLKCKTCCSLGHILCLITWMYLYYK